MSVTQDTPLTDLPGVGEARAKKLEKLGLTAVGDLLAYYPRDYEDRRKVYAIKEAPLEGRVCIAAMAAEHPRLSRIRKGLELVQVKVVDHSGALHLTFFNQGYVERAIRAGEEYIFYGTVEEQGRRRSMVNPIFERLGKQSFTGCIMPVYRLTAGDQQPPAGLPGPAGPALRPGDSRNPAPAHPSGPSAGGGGVLRQKHPFPRK